MQNKPYTMGMMPYEYQGLSCACDAQGLGAFWKSLWSRVRGVLGKSIIGGIALAILDASTDSSNNRSVSNNTLLTQDEIIQVTGWIDTYFSPFYEKISKQIDAVFLPGVTLDEQLKVVNECKAKMNIIKVYILTNPNGFSKNANDEQYAGALEYFAVLEKAIDEIIKKSNTFLVSSGVNVTSVGMNLFPFSPATPVKGISTIYKNTTGIATDNVIQAVNTTPLEFPKTIEVSGITTQISTATPVTQNVMESKPITGNGSGVIIGVGLLALLILLASKKDQKTKK